MQAKYNFVYMDKVKEYFEEIASRISASTDHVRLKKAGISLLGDAIYASREVKFRRPDGKELSYTLCNEYVDGYNKLEMISLDRLDRYSRFNIEWYPGDVAYLKIGTFMPKQGVEEGLEKALPELQKRAKKLIIDLRYNGGGNSGFAGTIMGHFIPDTLISDGSRITPSYKASYASWGCDLQPEDTIGNKRNRDYYLNYQMLATSDDGFNQFYFPKDYPRVVVPTLILTNFATCSSSENFLVMADGQKHIKVMGEPTSGSTGNPIQVPLIPGLSCSICTIKNTYVDGREFVGVGIKPDIEIKETLENYLSGKDVVLEAALKYMGTKSLK